MTNFIEEQQKEARKKLTSPEKVVRDALGKTTDAIVTETITNTLNHILESGLLEEKDVSGEFLCDLVYRMPPQDGDTVTHTHVDYSARKGHNTAVRNIKELLEKLSK